MFWDLGMNKISRKVGYIYHSLLMLNRTKFAKFIKLLKCPTNESSCGSKEINILVGHFSLKMSTEHQMCLVDHTGSGRPQKRFCLACFSSLISCLYCCGQPTSSVMYFFVGITCPFCVKTVFFI